MKTKVKVTLYMGNVFYDHREVDDPKEIAHIVKQHLSHLGNVDVYYEIPYEMIPWWKKLLRNIAGTGY